MAHHQPTVHVIELTKPPVDADEQREWIALAEKFRNLRLRALKIAPEAFASSHEIESQRGLDQTFERLKNQKARQFVAVESDDAGNHSCASGADLANICKHEWAGMVVVFGPVEVGILAREDPYKQMVADHENTRMTENGHIVSSMLKSREFVLNGVFVEPSVRGKGAGKALIEAAVKAVKTVQGQGMPPPNYEISVTALVHVENLGARKLYEKAGFVAVGEETYRQEPRALLGESRWVEKTVVKMRRTVSLDG